MEDSMRKHALRVKKWIHSGELDTDDGTEKKILDHCGSLLDSAESHEIIGEVLFQATNGKYYVVTVEAVIGLANPEYVKGAKARAEAE
jgi:hypothetical protein